MTTSKQLLSIGVKRTGKALNARFLTIHSTGNPTSTAQNERDWLTNPSNTSGTGWHVVVDDKQAIEAIPTNEVAYHAGTVDGNNQSVGLEICESGDREKTLRNAAEISAELLVRLGLTPDNLRQHYDWSGKNCPRILRDTGRWEEFRKMVENAYNKRVQPEPVLDNTPDGYAKDSVIKAVNKDILRGDSIGNLRLHDPITRQDLVVLFDRLGLLG